MIKTLIMELAMYAAVVDSQLKCEGQALFVSEHLNNSQKCT